MYLWSMSTNAFIMTKPTKWPLRPVKTQISLGISPVLSESSLCAQWVAKEHADSEDSDQTGQMHRLIWVFAGRTNHFVGFVMQWLISASRSLLIWTASSEFGTYRLCEQRRFRRAVSPEPPLLAHASSESRGTFRQKARSLAPLNGWACAVTICHDGMLEDTNSLILFLSFWTDGTGQTV